MKIVILDSETVSRNDVSLEGITVLGESIVYGFTPNEQVAEKIGDADAVICNKCLITEEVFSKCKNLKYVGLFERDIIMLTYPPQTGMTQWSAMCLHIQQTQLLSILLHLSSIISAR